MHAILASGRSTVHRSALTTAALLAGLVAAAIEMLPVLTIQATVLGVPPMRIFQSIASGVTGAVAYAGGVPSALLGLALHVVISIVAASAYVLAAVRSAWLLRHPFLGGSGFGVICWFVMSEIVVPLSAVAFRPVSSLALTLTSVFVHIVAFGLPIALISSWSLRRGF